MIIEKGDITPDVFKQMERLIKAAWSNKEKRHALIVENALKEAVDNDNFEYLKALQLLNRIPVDITEFIDSKEFFADQIDVWDTLRDGICEANPDVWLGQPAIHEAILGGAAGTGKTSLSHITNAYQIYQLTCLTEPQRLYDMAPSTPIVFMYQSVSSTVTVRVIFKPLKQMLTSMPYFKKYVKWDRYKESTLDIEGNITLVPSLANVESMVGQAIAGGMMDEANFMSVVENSKRVPGPRGKGGRFDQAEDAYMNITRRRKSRFETKGISLGCLCTLSSTRYKDDFIDRRMQEVLEYGEKNIYIFRKIQYEMQPKFVNDKNLVRFPILVGTDRYPTRILKKNEVPGLDYPENGRVEHVPVAYLGDFRRDPEGALRDVIGVATDTISAFISQRHKIVDAIVAGAARGLKQWIDRPECILSEHGMPQWIEENLPQGSDRNYPRWAHIDLSKIRDRCGIAIGRPLGFANSTDPESGLVESLPVFAIECALSIQPSIEYPIEPGVIRRWLLQLVAHYGMSFEEITFDGFQSWESQTTLVRSGIKSRVISMDSTTEPYEYLRRALYDDRIIMVDNEIARVELANLEHHADKGIVDHPPKGSKDIADAICGVTFAISTNRGATADMGYMTQGGQTMDGGPQGGRIRRPKAMRPRARRA